jgi:hypothetical protein
VRNQAAAGSGELKNSKITGVNIMLKPVFAPHIRYDNAKMTEYNAKMA